eukprot:353125-Chlamydomonas_euryale.AAC.11
MLSTWGNYRAPPVRAHTHVPHPPTPRTHTFHQIIIPHSASHTSNTQTHPVSPATHEQHARGGLPIRSLPSPSVESPPPPHTHTLARPFQPHFPPHRSNQCTWYMRWQSTWGANQIKPP